MPHKSSSGNYRRVSRHRVSHGDCNHCDRVFGSATAYRLHLKVHHPGENDKMDSTPKNICASCKKQLPRFARRCDRCT